MSNPAAFARRDKDAHPDRYCRVPSCLWITARTPCRNHPVATTLSACTDCEIVAPDVKLSRDGQSRCAGCELIEQRTTPPRYQDVSCSHCGHGFGPGEHGFSHCENHAGKQATS